MDTRKGELPIHTTPYILLSRALSRSPLPSHLQLNAQRRRKCRIARILILILAVLAEIGYVAEQLSPTLLDITGRWTQKIPGQDWSRHQTGNTKAAVDVSSEASPSNDWKLLYLAGGALLIMALIMKILYRVMRTLGKTGRYLFEEAIIACSFASVVSAYAVDIFLAFIGETSWDWYKIIIPSLNSTGLCLTVYIGVNLLQEIEYTGMHSQSTES